MLRKRLIVVIVMIPILALVVAVGGYLYTGLVSIAIGLAAWEFWAMFRKGGYFPSAPGMIGGAVLICLRSVFSFINTEFLIAFVVMAMMVIHLVNYERGQQTSPLGFCITLAGALYWGLMGGFLINILLLPDGVWWFFIVIPAVWWADAGGFVFGSRFGKHAMAPRLSPKKTWEGYVGGVVVAVVMTAVLGAIWHIRAEEITWERGMLLGGVIGLLAPLGDVGASMFKRQFNLKDTSNLIPGHGGIIDRIDTWVWAAALGYFVISFLI